MGGDKNLVWAERLRVGVVECVFEGDWGLGVGECINWRLRII